MIEQITSAQNPKIKQLLLLEEKSRTRKDLGLFVVEGVREIERCAKAGFELATLFVCPDIAGDEYMSQAFVRRCPQLIEVSRSVYSKIAYRDGTEGMIAEVRSKDTSLAGLKLRENPLIVVLESVEKPGNLGAVLRSADAAGADAVVVCDPRTDLYNPNLIRASLGAFFTVPCVACSTEEAIDYLKTKGVKILTAQLQDSSWYYNTDMTGATAIVIGTEATGLTDAWRAAADAHIKIPMLGVMDSLNASVSAAILLFEAVRQRNTE